MDAQLRLPCPQCGRDLRVRAEYIGRRITCKKCENTFRAILQGDNVSLCPPWLGADESPPGGEEEEALAGQPQTAADPDQQARWQESLHKLERERDDLLSQIAALEVKAAEVAELRPALEAQRSENERLRANLESKAGALRVETQAGEARQRELEAVRAEREALSK